jgi:hypothetical protein
MTRFTSCANTARRLLPCALLLVLLSACGGGEQSSTAPSAPAPAAPTSAEDPDHHEFEATLEAPFTSAAASGERIFTMRFSYSGATEPRTIAWQLELLDAESRVMQQWQGEEPYRGSPLAVDVAWAGKTGSLQTLADGSYHLRLTAAAADAAALTKATGTASERVQKVS